MGGVQRPVRFEQNAKRVTLKAGGVAHLDGNLR